MKVLKWIGIGVAALIVLPVLTLVVLHYRPNAGKMHASVEIGAPPQQVWAWIDDGQRLKQWVSWMVEVQEAQPGRRGVGSSLTWVMKDENNGGASMKLNGRITEYTPPTRLAIAISEPVYGINGVQAYTLTDLGSGRTRIDTDAHYDYGNWFASLMEPLVTPAAGKKMNDDLARLKGLIETNADAAR